MTSGVFFLGNLANRSQCYLPASLPTAAVISSIDCGAVSAGRNGKNYGMEDGSHLLTVLAAKSLSVRFSKILKKDELL